MARTVVVSFMMGLLLPAACLGQNADWNSYNGGVDGDHYSSLTQINRRNVGGLKVAWSYNTGETGGLQDNPLIVGGTLYAYTPTQKLIALDAATGVLKWKFDSGIEGLQPSRGVVYWSDGSNARIFAGIMNFLYCLDAVTGKPVATFGDDGRIDLRKDLGGDYRQQSIALTTPGILYKDMIIVGGRNPESHPAPPGDIRAYDIHTGKLRWSFHTIPRPGEPGIATWPKDAWKNAGAANNWAGMALDAARGIVYVPTGSAVMDFYGGDRLGDDLYANTILALDANTGRRIWYFQGVHHDLWDRDFPAPPALFSFMRNGHRVDALAQTTKQGYLYLFDRVNGQPLFPIHEFKVPPSHVPGEVASPTQPRPDAPQPFARQLLTEQLLTTRTPEAHAWAVQAFRQFRSQGQFVPFSLDKQTVVFPGFDGGAEWGGPAIDPAAGVLYVNANEMAWTGGLTRIQNASKPGARIYQGQCAACHGVDRSGAPPDFPSLLGVENRLGAQKVIDVVKRGSGRMPSFPNLSDADVQSLLAFLRGQASEGQAQGAREMASVAAQTSPSPATGNAAGAEVYKSRCAFCHGDRLEGQPPSIPMLIGVGNRLSAAEISANIHQGKGAMPPMPDLQGRDLTALLEFLGRDKAPAAAAPGAQEFAFTGYKKFLDPDGYPAITPPWGTLNAIDLKTGKYLWKIPLGEYPKLAAEGIKNTGSENYGGPIVTAGGVLFIGATVYDRKFRAFDTSTGKLLWEADLPYAGVATPAPYMENGRQYVVIATSGERDRHGPAGSAYVAFALGK